MALHRPSRVKDLGITFDTQLDFSLHTDNTVSSTYKKLGFLKLKTNIFSNQDALNVLYFALIFCIYEVHQNKIKQKLFTKTENDSCCI